MIYTRFWTPVNIVASEVRFEKSRLDGSDYAVYWVKAVQSAPHPDAKSDADREVGRPILDGEWFPASELRADNGWGEIEDACLPFHEAELARLDA